VRVVPGLGPVTRRSRLAQRSLAPAPATEHPSPGFAERRGRVRLLDFAALTGNRDGAQVKTKGERRGMQYWAG
jgi:hypothetical protein